MRIAIAKPDYGVRGGFELVIDRLAEGLIRRGHEVRWLCPEVARLQRQPFGVDVSPSTWAAEPEFFTYMALVDVFGQLDTRWADVVISGQPPSFVVHHPRHLCLFSHHHRLYYDLADVALAAGLVNPVIHGRAREHVHAVDAAALQRVNLVLAASEEVRSRLRTYNQIEAGLYEAGAGFRSDPPEQGPHDALVYPLCVSRHEFPKRTELFVHAMALLSSAGGVCVGGGGRLGWAQELDRRFGLDPASAWSTPSTSLWMCNPGVWPPVNDVARSPANVAFAGVVSAAALDAYYRRALCVVAPSYREDYGLTAIEAMAYGKPLIVCTDGGHLRAFVRDGINGFVVEPEAMAIAEAVRRLVDDRALARRLGEAGREMSREYTWHRALTQVEDGLARVAA